VDPAGWRFFDPEGLALPRRQGSFGDGSDD
jgi:hypothetical protein